MHAGAHTHTHTNAHYWLHSSIALVFLTCGATGITKIMDMIARKSRMHKKHLAGCLFTLVKMLLPNVKVLPNVNIMQITCLLLTSGK